MLWEDFNYNTLHSIFATVVDAEWMNPPTAHRLGIDPLEREIVDEKSFDLHHTKHLMPLVNLALVRANTLLGYDPTHQVHLWSSGRAYISSGRPDWSFCSLRKADISTWLLETRSCRRNGNQIWRMIAIPSGHFRYAKSRLIAIGFKCDIAF